MKKLFILCAVIAALACKQKAKESAAISTTEMVVAVQPQLALREGHDVKSRIIQQVPYGEKVKILTDAAYAGPDVEILGLTGRWQRIEYKNTKGWVFAPLLKKADEAHRIVIMNGRANTDDMQSQPSGFDADVIRDSDRKQIEIQLAYEQGTMSCEGKLQIGAGGKVSSPKEGSVRCGGVGGDAVYSFNRWIVYKGRIYLTGVNNAIGVCHSERCENQDLSHTESVAKALAITKKAGDNAYQAQLVDDFH